MKTIYTLFEGALDNKIDEGRPMLGRAVGNKQIRVLRFDGHRQQKWQQD